MEHKDKLLIVKESALLELTRRAAIIRSLGDEQIETALRICREDEATRQGCRRAVK